MPLEAMRLRHEVWQLLAAVRRFDVAALRKEIDEAVALLKTLGWKEPLCETDVWGANLVEQLQRTMDAANEADEQRRRLLSVREAKE